MLTRVYSGFSCFLSSETDFAADFVTQYLPIPVFVILLVGKKLWSKTKFVRTSESTRFLYYCLKVTCLLRLTVDFYTGQRDVMEEEDEPPAKNLVSLHLFAFGMVYS